MEPDDRLVTRALAGSPEAADALFRRHWLDCWRVACGILGTGHGFVQVALGDIEIAVMSRAPGTTSADLRRLRRIPLEDGR